MFRFFGGYCMQEAFLFGSALGTILGVVLAHHGLTEVAYRRCAFEPLSSCP